MIEISAEKVRELREKTGAGIMDCKKALGSTDGDLSQAVDLLRKEGVIKAAKKAGRTTQEGLIGIAVSADKRQVSLVEINCETDFVARTDQFLEFLSAVSENVLVGQAETIDEFLNQKLGTGTTQEALTQFIARVGENTSIRRFALVRAGENEDVGSYIHAGSKIGVLIRVKRGTNGKVLDAGLVRDLAMHAAAMAPRYLNRTQVTAAVLQKEKEVLLASPELASKPANLHEKIVEGKLNRFYSESCFVEQAFIKDPTGKKTIAEFLKENSPGAEVVEMVRFQVGEEIL